MYDNSSGAGTTTMRLSVGETGGVLHCSQRFVDHMHNLNRNLRHKSLTTVSLFRNVELVCAPILD